LARRRAAWLARDPDRLGTSLVGYAGHPAYGTAPLRQDLDGFTFLLGGNGESLWPWRGSQRRRSPCPPASGHPVDDE
jgi:hypothetical protein